MNNDSNDSATQNSAAIWKGRVNSRIPQNLEGCHLTPESHDCGVSRAVNEFVADHALALVVTECDSVDSGITRRSSLVQKDSAAHGAARDTRIKNLNRRERRRRREVGAKDLANKTPGRTSVHSVSLFLCALGVLCGSKSSRPAKKETAGIAIRASIPELRDLVKRFAVPRVARKAQTSSRGARMTTLVERMDPALSNLIPCRASLLYSAAEILD
jgi:hypothetical protein